MQEMQALARRYLLGLWRRRWLALGLAWVFCLAGWAATFAVPNQYEANARLYVDADAVLTPLLHGVALDNTPANQLEILQRTLLSRPNLEKLISKTDLELSVGGPAELENMVQSLASAIRVTPQTRNLFTISYRNSRPQLAYDVVQTVLAIFIESKTGNSRTDMENARVFLEQQISQYETKLRASEAARAQFRAKYLDLLPDDKGGASHLDAARAQVVGLQDQLKQAQLRLDLTNKQLAETPPTIAAESLPGAAAGGEAGGPKPCQDYELALASLTEKNPTVIRLRAQCEEARKLKTGGGGHGTVTHSVANPVYEKLKLQVFDLQAEIASLTQQIADRSRERDRLEGIARAQPEVMARYTDLNRDYDVLHKNYEELIARREAMRLAAAADTEAEKVKLRVVDPPQVPQVPAFPNRVLLVTAVLGLGLAGGVGVALALLQFDTSFHSLDELRRLELPVVGGISLIAAAVPLRRRLVGLGSFAGGVLLLGAAYGGLLLRMLEHNGLA
jgi:polysaccharide chain length determinant protein (PEP-CTERM system associated)